MTRRRARRLTRTMLGLVVAIGLIHAVAAKGDDDRKATAGKPTVSTPGGLFDGQLIVEGIHGFTSAEVRRIGAAAGAAPLTVSDGEVYVIRGSGTYNEAPLATMTATADGYAAAAGSKDLGKSLASGPVVSTSAAALFNLHKGDRVQLAHGRSLTISAVVDDRALGGYQLGVGRSISVGLGSHADYVIVHADTARVDAVQSAIQGALPSRRLRFTQPSAHEYFSPMGDVLSQSQLDQRFGVFLVRETASGIELDPRWISAYIVQRRIVQLGSVFCNKQIIGSLTAAMQEITHRGLGKTIDTADFIYEGGCWNPRTVRFGHGMISHHAWGMAIDINVGRNPLGAVARQDPRLVAIMAKYGFTWGGPWLRHDGAHFEWVGPHPTELAG
jgi:hypothetical protein